MTRRTTFIARWRQLRWLLVAAVVAAGLCPVLRADPLVPGRDDRHIVWAVTSLLKQHLSRHPLDKEISERALKTFLKTLDLRKVYFYQSDIDEFTKHKDELSDAINNRDVSFAYTVFRTFLQRVDERVKTVDELLAVPQDFTVDEEMVKDRDTAKYPRDAAEARDLWRKLIKHDLLVLKANKKEDANLKTSTEKEEQERKNDKAAS